jgi:hypothetical protein
VFFIKDLRCAGEAKCRRMVAQRTPGHVNDARSNSLRAFTPD